ncbi:hypothetical protein T484DRAFT_1935387 [Baffinella frigidus]|nr:hypothetical protein T484DRAFT_1935387 [Cryptophyta sp. CCMP2293]
MIGQGIRRQRALTFSTTLLLMASTMSVASAFSPTMLLSQIKMRRSAIKARLLWRSARPGVRSSFSLVRDSIEEEEIRKEVLENAFDNIVFNKGLDRVVGSALHNMFPPEYEKLASSLPSLSNLHMHLHIHLPGVTAHAIGAALPAVAMDHASIEHLLATLPVWAVIPGVALLAAAAALPPQTNASVTSSIVPFHPSRTPHGGGGIGRQARALARREDQGRARRPERSTIRRRGRTVSRRPSTSAGPRGSLGRASAASG